MFQMSSKQNAKRQNTYFFGKYLQSTDLYT